MDTIYIFYLILFITAFLYASVGHGGASGYLALMALYEFSPDVMKPTALMLNLFVSLTSFVQFYRGKHFKWNIFLPLALASVPCAYLGGLMTVDGAIYKKLLAAFLVIPVCRFLFFPNIPVTELRRSNILISILIGAAIGLLSGMIGIGGGIILSPILLLLKWTDQKQTAAISALFIFVNSLSGLAGQLQKGINFSSDMALYVVIAFVGGLFGAYYGAIRFNQNVLKYVLGIVLLMASVKLYFF